LREILRLENVKKHFGGIRAVDGVSVQVDEGSLVGLIGPNGSGKTTLFNVISGVYKPDAGVIYFRDERIDGLDPHKIFLKGVVRSFQNPRLFLGMTVLENTMLPPPGQLGERVFNAPFGWRWRKQETSLARAALETMDKHQLSNVRLHWSTDVSGGQMKLLEVCRAMMGEPKLLLLDEPTAGVAPKLTRDIFDTIVRLRNELGLTFFIIEHRLEVLFDYVERVLVMHQGKIISDGTPDEVVNDQRVIDAYLGG
jgi:branched-chain amino acid transport system ATP-binding protein